jgi:hypothetical protein
MQSRAGFEMSGVLPVFMMTRANAFLRPRQHVFLDNYGGTAQWGKISAQEHIERVEEDAHASFEEIIEHRAYLPNRSVLAANILLKL